MIALHCIFSIIRENKVCGASGTMEMLESWNAGKGSGTAPCSRLFGMGLIPPDPLFHHFTIPADPPFIEMLPYTYKGSGYPASRAL
jgi:hypothetical protein